VRQLLDPDLRDVLDGAERDAREVREEQERRLVEGERLGRADELIATLVQFELNLTEASVIREQARRDGVVHDDGYDRAVLGMEAAVIDLCTQLLDLSLRDGDHETAEAVLGRLDRGLARVRAERDEAIGHGWLYRREKKMIASREIEWEQAVEQASRRARR
jgi:hypothetical protein